MEPLFKRKHTYLHEHATLPYKLDINLLDRSFHRNIALTVNIKSIKSELTRSMEQQKCNRQQAALHCDHIVGFDPCTRIRSWQINGIESRAPVPPMANTHEYRQCIQKKEQHRPSAGEKTCGDGGREVRK